MGAKTFGISRRNDNAAANCQKPWHN